METFYVEKRMTFAAAHWLQLPYVSPCAKVHGHEWVVKIGVKGKQLNKEGMLCDFKKIKDCINRKYDHTTLNDNLTFNPTAENIAREICKDINALLEDDVYTDAKCVRVELWESESNKVVYENVEEV